MRELWWDKLRPRVSLCSVASMVQIAIKFKDFCYKKVRTSRNRFKNSFFQVVSLTSHSQSHLNAYKVHRKKKNLLETT